MPGRVVVVVDTAGMARTVVDTMVVVVALDLEAVAGYLIEI